MVALAAALLAFAVLEPIVAFLFPAQPARIVDLSRDFKVHRGFAYRVQYQFDRSGFIGHDEVLPDEYRELQVGQAINAHVVHLGRFGYSILDRSPGAYARNRMINWFCTAFAAAIGWVFFHAVWLMPRRARWLAQNGEATFGAVVVKSVVQRARRHLFCTLTYQFKVNGTLRARRIRVSPQRYDAAQLGDLITILFDPKRPGRSIVYEYSDFIAMRPVKPLAKEAETVSNSVTS